MRDTKFERTQHEATGRHQGNLKRFLRDLHRDQERGQREKDRAKAEVERLNGVVSGQPTASSNQNASAGFSQRRAAQPSLPPAPRQATAEERKRQMAQLAEMGVAVPQEYRAEMAMASEWQVVSEKIIPQRVKEEEDDDEDEEEKHNKNVSAAWSSKRKRREHDDDEHGEDERPARRKGWGSTIKTYPGSESVDADLEALLGSNKLPEGSGSTNDAGTAAVESQVEPNTEGAHVDQLEREQDEKQDVPVIKRETSDGQSIVPPAVPEASETPDVKAESETQAQAQEGEVFFKKRKAKNIRQK